MEKFSKRIFLLKGQNKIRRMKDVHRDLGELLLGEVQRMVDGGDAKLLGSVGGRKESPQDGVVGHVHVGHHGVPAFVVVPDLRRQTSRNLTLLTSSFQNNLWNSP